MTKIFGPNLRHQPLEDTYVPRAVVPVSHSTPSINKLGTCIFFNGHIDFLFYLIGNSLYSYL